jgi:hypothetical protein
MRANLSEMSPPCTVGCAFHLHVPFWRYLSDLWHWNGQDIEKTLRSDSLTRHLAAYPFLNLTFCVRFSHQNNFPMTLPAELRATNVCACDLDMRLNFSKRMRHWVFSCPNYHQKASKTCIHRVFAMDARYNLMSDSANLNGGTLPPQLNMQTSPEMEVPFADSDQIVVRLPRNDNVASMSEDESEEDMVREFFSDEMLRRALSDDESVASPRENILRNEAPGGKILNTCPDRLHEKYLWQEKHYDELTREKIKEEEKFKREEARLRLKANVVTCLTCCEAAATCVFLPCFHMVLCEKCVDKGIRRGGVILMFSQAMSLL